MRVALFITCVNDTLFPGTGKAVVTLLRRLGCEVEFPQAQTCCGQMHLNTGYPEESVRLAIFADIHANRQAFSACLDFARARGAEKIVCLGDVVGYGADPEWAVDTVMDLVADGGMIVMGAPTVLVGP